MINKLLIILQISIISHILYFNKIKYICLKIAF